MIGHKRKGEYVGRKDETIQYAKSENVRKKRKKPFEEFKKSGAIEKRFVNNKPEDKKTTNQQRPNNKGAFAQKKKPWFMHKHSKDIENGKTEQKRNETVTEEKSLPVIKTVATYSKLNFSSNWKTLAQALHLNEGTKKPDPPHKSKEKKFPKSVKRVKPKVTEEHSQVAVNEPQVSHPLDVWFDDVDEELLRINEAPSTLLPQRMTMPSTPASSNDYALAKPGNFSGATKTVAMDCEMVGVGEGGKDSILARVSIVNRMGHTVYDKFVKPREKVTDYRTHVSGVRPSDLENAEDFETVQKEVYEIINGRILVGHAVYNDLKVLFLSHPKSKIRDTSKYKPFRKLFDGRNPSLKKLAEKLVGVAVQTGEHNSVQDAQAAMRLYTMHRKVWEKEIRIRRVAKKKQESVVK